MKTSKAALVLLCTSLCVVLSMNAPTAMSKNIAKADTTTVMFISTEGVCQSACTIQMRNLVSMLSRHLKHRTVAASLHVRNARRITAKGIADQAGLSLVDTIPEDLRLSTSGMRLPLVVIGCSADRRLIVDDLYHRSPEFLTSIVDELPDSLASESREPYLITKQLRSMDSIGISWYQALNDSAVLFYDKVGDQAAVVDTRRDRVIRRARIPDAVRNQYRTPELAADWDALQKRGGKLTRLYSAYVHDEFYDSITFCISQSRITKDTVNVDTLGSVQQIKIMGVGARWLSLRDDEEVPDTVILSRVAPSRNWLMSTALQSLSRVSVLSGGTKNFYSSNPDSQTIAVYVRDGVEHPLVRCSDVKSDQGEWDFSGYTEVSDIHKGRLMIANASNDVFGLYDTTKRTLHNIEPVGPLSYVLTKSGVNKQKSPFWGGRFLVDNDKDRYVIVSHRLVDESSTSNRLGVIVSTFSADGDLLQTKVFDEQLTGPPMKLEFYHVSDGYLLGIHESYEGVSSVRLKL